MSELYQIRDSKILNFIEGLNIHCIFFLSLWLLRETKFWDY